MVIAKKHQEKLEELKKCIEISYDYNRENADRWYEFQKFVFLTSLSENDRDILDDLQKPQIEFNILEAYISRLCGEFSKQQPSIEAYEIGDSTLNPKTIEVIEGYFRNMEYESRHNGTANKTYRDQLSGGYSVAKVWVEYANSHSFEPVIKWDRVFDPTLCGFDPIAVLPHKGDGRYSFECFPKPREWVEKKYNVNLDGLKYTRNPTEQKKDAYGNSKSVGSFNWSYKTSKESIVMVCDLYKKESKSVKIHQLVGGKVVTDDEYNELLKNWEQFGQPPAIIQSRTTQKDVIMKYVFVEDQLLTKPIETNFAFLPHVFFDGNSVLLRDTENGEVTQYTRPYIYQAIGAQRLKNFAGQSLGSELENLVQHKFMVPVEAIPNEYKEAYTTTQVPNVLLYNQFKDNDPNVRLDPPREIQRPPIPAEIAGAFAGADSVVQGILGSYDASLGINNNQLSGVAIVEGATQSNAAAMPYVVNYLAGLGQIARIVIDLIPKYVVTPSTIPVIGKDGKRSYQRVNEQGQPMLNYNSENLNIKVEAGVNFEIQKDKNLRMLREIMQISPVFAQFIGSQGLPILLDNIDIKGADQLKALAEKYVQQQQSQPPQPNPEMIKAQTAQQKVMQDGQIAQENLQIKKGELALDMAKVDNARIQAMAAAGDDQISRDLEQQKVDAEKARSAVDLEMKAMDMEHRHAKENAELAHKVNNNEEENNGNNM
jgi:hypothetical protein